MHSDAPAFAGFMPAGLRLLQRFSGRPQNILQYLAGDGDLPIPEGEAAAMADGLSAELHQILRFERDPNDRLRPGRQCPPKLPEIIGKPVQLHVHCVGGKRPA